MWEPIKRWSTVAQWKRAGPITQRSVDRNHFLLTSAKSYKVYWLKNFQYFLCASNPKSRKNYDEQFSIERLSWPSRPKVTRYTDKRIFTVFFFYCILLIETKMWETLERCSRVAQWKRAGPITQRSVDRNQFLLPAAKVTRYTDKKIFTVFFVFLPRKAEKIMTCKFLSNGSRGPVG